MQGKKKYHIDLEFQPVVLPPVQDVLVVCRKYPQGKHGIMEAFKFIAPDEFDMYDIEDDISEIVEAILINKRILKKLPLDGVVSILADQVFPYISQGEAIRVDLNMKISSSVVWNPEE